MWLDRYSRRTLNSVRTLTLYSKKILEQSYESTVIMSLLKQFPTFGSRIFQYDNVSMYKWNKNSFTRLWNMSTNMVKKANSNNGCVICSSGAVDPSICITYRMLQCMMLTIPLIRVEKC